MKILRACLIGAALAFLLAALAAWQIPPRLDWARYRQAIAALAAARIGRPVAIGGQVHLTLLPQPELTARDVTLADRGDGISARIGALRLQVALWPLLRGRVVPRSLALDDPTVIVPWPLPRAAATGVPTVAQGFSAHVEGGTLNLGGLAPGAIVADMHVDPDTGAFSAAGTATLGGRIVGFNAVIGAPGRDGVATLSLSLDGQGGLAGAGANFHGRIAADGGVDGVLRAGGPDFSRLMPAPSLPWRLQGPMQASTGQARAADLFLMLGASPGHGAATLRLAPPARLDVIARVGHLPLGAWAIEAGGARAPFPMRLDLAAAAATLAGGTIRDAHAVLSMTPTATTMESADATLPGGAALHLSGVARPSAQGAAFSGPLHVRVPDPPATLAWLRASLPGLSPGQLPEFSGPATIDGDLTFAASMIGLKNLRLGSGGVVVTGEAALTRAPRPALRVSLQTDALTVTEWPTWLPARPRALAGAFGGIDMFLDMQSARWVLPDLTLSRVRFSVQGDARGIALHGFSADVPGAHLEAAGALAPDGTVADAKLDLDAADAAALPAAWRRVPGLWHGPLHMALTAAGAAHAVSMQVRCDLGDLRAESEGVIDTEMPSLAATATLRHPGAPRLLAQAGIADSGRWLEQGSVAVIAHISARPGDIELQDFSVAAASLLLTGRASIDLSGAVPTVAGTVDAPSLALPAFDPRSEAPLPFGVLAGWQGSVHVAAARVLADLRPAAGGFTADVTVANGALLMDGVVAHFGGGTLRGAVALDGGAPLLAARGEIQGAGMVGIGAAPPWRWTQGSADLSADVTAAGHSPLALLASLAGTARGTLQAASLQDVDLPRVRALLAARGARLKQSLAAAMASGETGALAGGFVATADHGAIDLAARGLSGAAGRVDIAGIVDMPAQTEDVTVRLEPAVTAPPTLGVRLVGGLQLPRRVPDLSDALAWAGVGAKPRRAGH